MTTIQLGLAGRFKIEAFNPETGERREISPWFDNLITNQGLNQLGNGIVTTYCMVGTGTGTPVVTDTTLGAQVASTSTTSTSSSGVSGTAPYYGWRRYVFRFAAGAAAGNLTEIGIGQTSTAVFSRTLIKDANGNPTTITVLPSEVLDVTYELRLYAPASDVTFTTVIAGVTHNCIIRAASVLNSIKWGTNISGQFTSQMEVYSGAIGAVTESPAGLIDYVPSGMTQAAYVANSYQRTASFQIGLSLGNHANGIQCAVIASSMGHFQISFSPSIMKTSSKVLTLNFTLSWARQVV